MSDVDRRTARKRRHWLKSKQRQRTHAISSRNCLTGTSSFVAIDVNPADGIARLGSVARCGSPWSCPTCAAGVREERARDIDMAAAEALERGWSILFVTLTAPHASDDPLRALLDLMVSSLGRTLKGRQWDGSTAKLDHYDPATGEKTHSTRVLVNAGRKHKLGYRGAIKAVEVTHGVNGWHPHTHVLMFFDRQLDVAQVGGLKRWLLRQWAAVVRKAGHGEISERHGVDVRAVRSTGDLGGYLTKVDGGWGAGLEIARADVKKSRGGRTALQLLEDAATTGDARDVALWDEYEQATFGKRAIVWSRGLWDELLGNRAEKSDEEAAAGPGEAGGVMVALIPSGMWRSVVMGGWAADWMTRAEVGGALVLGLLALVGADPWAHGHGRERGDPEGPPLVLAG